MMFSDGMVLNVDCLLALDLMSDNHVDLIWTDPAYKVVSGGTKRAEELGYGYNRSVLHKNDGKIFKHNKVKPSDYMARMFRVLKPGGHCYVMTNRINLEAMLTSARLAGFSLANLLFWGKDNKNPNRMYMIETEVILMFYKRPAVKIADCGQSQIIKIPTVKKPEKTHPTQKPVELPAYFIEQSSEPDDLVLDPFLGNGATAIAAAQLGRRFVGMELDREYYEQACARLAFV